MIVSVHFKTEVNNHYICDFITGLCEKQIHYLKMVLHQKICKIKLYYKEVMKAKQFSFRPTSLMSN